MSNFNDGRKTQEAGRFKQIFGWSNNTWTKILLIFSDFLKTSSKCYS